MQKLIDEIKKLEGLLDQIKELQNLEEIAYECGLIDPNSKETNIGVLFVGLQGIENAKAWLKVHMDYLLRKALAVQNDSNEFV